MRGLARVDSVAITRRTIEGRIFAIAPDFLGQDKAESIRERKRHCGTRASTFGDFANDELASVIEG